jgi:hypothetical protein
MGLGIVATIAVVLIVILFGWRLCRAREDKNHRKALPPGQQQEKPLCRPQATPLRQEYSEQKDKGVQVEAPGSVTDREVRDRELAFQRGGPALTPRGVRVFKGTNWESILQPYRAFTETIEMLDFGAVSRCRDQLWTLIAAGAMKPDFVAHKKAFFEVLDILDGQRRSFQAGRLPHLLTDDRQNLKCDKCGGVGLIPCEACKSGKTRVSDQKCLACGDTSLATCSCKSGSVWEKFLWRCPACDGKGWEGFATASHGFNRADEEITGHFEDCSHCRGTGHPISSRKAMERRQQILTRDLVQIIKRIIKVS